MKHNPHMSIVALEPPSAAPRRWRCDFCKLEGLYDALRAVECSYVYPPCESCGGTPECAPDCKAMLMILTSPEVRVIGTIPKGKP
jgi:hypothetical protein